MNKRDLIESYFDELFSSPKCELNFSNNFELIVAVILSAQCTDKRVNIVTKKLFELCPTPKHMLDLGIDKLKEIIKPCGFFNNKAKNIYSMCEQLLEKHNGQVPNTLNELVSLSGVGKKTANVVLSVAFNEDAFAVDTHVKRVSQRLDLTNNQNPLKIEQDLNNYFEKSKWSKLHYQMVLFGRYVCKARNPDCNNCKLKDICKYYKRK